MQKQHSMQNSEEFHVAIIMDGNGRWAQRHGKARFFGHRAGAEAVRRVVETAPQLGIATLTLYEFSCDNWKRSEREIALLMQLFRTYLQMEVKNCIKNGVKLSFIGRRDRLDPDLIAAMQTGEMLTAQGKTVHLRIAIDYSARDNILQAAKRVNGKNNISREEFAQLLAEAYNCEDPAFDVDLLIRTGGEKRLSDFLLWECAYAELYFTELMWPDFGADELKTAVEDFKRRERRFGRIPVHSHDNRKKVLMS
jgi:undecaprenyl diphosphate synthase